MSRTEQNIHPTKTIEGDYLMIPMSSLSGQQPQTEVAVPGAQSKLSSAITDVVMITAQGDQVNDDLHRVATIVPEIQRVLGSPLGDLIADPRIVEDDTLWAKLHEAENVLGAAITNASSKMMVINSVEKVFGDAIPDVMMTELGVDRTHRVALLTGNSESNQASLEKKAAVMQKEADEINRQLAIVDSARAGLLEIDFGLKDTTDWLTKQGEKVDGVEMELRTLDAELDHLDTAIIKQENTLSGLRKEYDAILQSTDPSTEDKARLQALIGEASADIDTLKSSRRDNLDVIHTKKTALTGLMEETAKPTETIGTLRGTAVMQARKGLNGLVPAKSFADNESSFYAKPSVDGGIEQLETEQSLAMRLDQYAANVKDLGQRLRASDDASKFTHHQMVELVECAQRVFAEHAEHVGVLLKTKLAKLAEEILQSSLETVAKNTTVESVSTDSQTAIVALTMSGTEGFRQRLAEARTAVFAEQAALLQARNDLVEAVLDYRKKGGMLTAIIDNQRIHATFLQQIEELRNANSGEMVAAKNHTRTAYKQIAHIVGRRRESHSPLVTAEETSQLAWQMTTGGMALAATDQVDEIYGDSSDRVALGLFVAGLETRVAHQEFLRTGVRVVNSLGSAALAGRGQAETASVLMADVVETMMAAAEASVDANPGALVQSIMDDNLRDAAQQALGAVLGDNGTLHERLTAALAVARGRGLPASALRRLGGQSDPLQKLALTTLASSVSAQNSGRAITR